MSEHSHRGARPPSPFLQSSDRRFLELDEALRTVEAIGGALPNVGLFRDSTRVANTKNQQLGSPGTFSRGVVIHALPGVHWYKVQVGDGAGWVAACMLAQSTMTPLGPRALAMVRPNDSVLLFKPRGLNYGFIVGVMPPYVANGSVLVPDWLVQGGGSGIRREEGHKFPIKNLYKGGGVIDWSSQRPQDQVGTEQGWISPFGLAIAHDDHMIQIRANEMAGLWMTFFDGWVRLAGEQLLIESPAHELDAGDDEGEARHFLGIATYPHEALGQMASGQRFTETNDDKDVQYTKHRGKEDLKQGEEDLAPMYRYQEYGGYLGQGHLRFVACSEKTSGARLYKDAASDQDVGLFMESIALDGGYSLVSAKSVHIGKRCRIVVPRVRRVTTDKAGDDAETDNYKFSSLFGGGDEHKVKDIKLNGELKSMLRVSAALEFAAYDLNWKAIHPFHYHKADYDTPQAANGKTLKKDQENISFDDADSEFYIKDPEPKQLKIDHRYGDVEFFERESFIRFHDDGTVHLAAGAGEELVLGGGRIFINAPGGIDVRPGTDFTVHASQIVMKAKGSIDLSSTDKDVRIKAENNFQVLAGNSEEGGILLESRGTGTTYQYQDKFGEDVRSSGIVLKAANSAVGVLGQDIYLRTGGDNLGEGDILLDANQGQNRVQLYSKEFHVYAQKEVTFNLGPTIEDSTVKRVYQFSDDTMIADVKLMLGGKLIGYNGGGGNAGIVVDGSVYGTGAFATASTMADKRGAMLGKVPSNFAGTITSQCDSAASAIDSLKQSSEERHKTSIVEKYYQEEQLGNDRLLEVLQFGFRDPPGSPVQYATERFRWPEARWQQFVRFGLGTGGKAWTEKSVLYQGQETYPWPGKTKLVDEPTYLQLESTKMFEAAEGVDAARPGPYEEPEIKAYEPVVLDGEYKLTR